MLLYLIPSYTTTFSTYPGAITHERTHSIFYENFKSNALVNKSHIFREAWADFLPAHFLGTPEIGPAFTNYVRNIETMQSGREFVKSFKDPMELHDLVKFFMAITQ